MNLLRGDVDCRSSGSATVKTSRARTLLCRASDDAEPLLPVIRQCYGSGTTVLRPRSTRVRQCYRRDAAAVSRGNLPFFPRSNTRELIFSLTRSWTWLPVLRQCFSSGAATDGHTTYKARPSTAKQKLTKFDQ